MARIKVPPAPRALGAVVPQPGAIASAAPARVVTVAARSEDCDKTPALAMSLLPGVEPEAPTPSVYDQAVGPTGGEPPPETTAVTLYPGTPTLPDDEDGGVFVPGGGVGGGDGGGGGVIFPPGGGGVVVVPEPGTWAMMLTGFFGVGGALRLTRRRRAAARTGTGGAPGSPAALR